MKSNKGITLIALVVTIIILLILAGVSITTLSGDGLFGRAQSAASKYETASQNENSMISSILDKYDQYERNNTEEGVTVTWTAAVATRGNFLSTTTPPTTETTNYFNKQILIIKPNGDKQVLNPYTSQTIKVPVGSKIRMVTYKDPTADKTTLVIAPDYGGGERSDIETTEADGTLVTVDYTITENTGFRMGVDTTHNVIGKETIWSLLYFDPEEGPGGDEIR